MEEIIGKVIVVTGGTKGVGKGLFETFSKNNTVIALARNVEEDGEKFFKCDVTDYEQVEVVFGKIIEKHKKIDILINNAGAGLGGAVEFLDVNLIDWQVKLNLMGAVYCTKAVLKYTPVDKDLKIINISSIGAFGVQPFRTMYSVAKSALNTFTVGMRQELHNTPVKVCSISLGDTQTDFGKHHPNDFTTSDRYGNRITHNDEKNAAISDAVKRDTRMPVDKAVEGIVKVVSKKKYRKATYLIGAKYKLLYILSRLFTMDQVSEIVRKLFEK